MQPDYYTQINGEYIVATSLEELLEKVSHCRQEITVYAGICSMVINVVRGAIVYIRYDLDLLADGIF